MIFSALADPTRRAILARLAAGEAPVKDLVQPFELSAPAITKHLKVLERAGLISRSRDGQQRPCRLEARALEPASEWLEQYRAMWEDQLDRLGAYLASTAPAAAPTQEHAPARERACTSQERAATPRKRSKRRSQAPRKARPAGR